MNLYKKLGISKEKSKPGDLISALNANKAKHGGAALFKKNHKSHMCKSCEKSCGSMSHHKMHKNLDKDGKKEKKHEKHHKHHKKDVEREDNDKFNREASHEEGIKEKKHRKNLSGAIHTSKKEKVHKEKKHEKNWIAGAIKHPGALHREMGVKEGHKIPARRLAAVAKKGGKIGKRARLAETLKGFHHKKKSVKKKSFGGDEPSLAHWNPTPSKLSGVRQNTFQPNLQGTPFGGNLNNSMAKRRAKKHKTNQLGANGSGPMVGSVGGYKKRGKKA
jgi:hypothetical protein